jgi:ABC-2 type transport system permease protein
LFCLEVGLVCVIVYLRYGLPDATMLVVTFCWLLFALPLQLAAGNLISIKMAYRMTLTRMSREEGAGGNALLSLAVQLVIVAVGAGIFFALSHYGYAGASGGIFLLLAVVSVGLWLRISSNIDRMAAARREELIQTLARA